MRLHFLPVNGVRLHVAEQGDGPPVLLLHGFPEFWYSWRAQIPALAAAGFRAVAPDLRGYNLSDKPRGVRAYKGQCLVEDLVHLIRDHLGGAAHVVGHDWGGILAWRLAALHPELVRSLAILNAPHPAAYNELLKRDSEQWLRSWYVGLFQLPWVAEAMASAGDYRMLERTFRSQPRGAAAFTPDDLQNYKAAWAQPGALTGGMNYYRAALRWPGDWWNEPQRIEARTLVLWGARDPYLSVRLVDNLGKWVDDMRIERFPEVSHWIQNEIPNVVNERLIDFLT